MNCGTSTDAEIQEIADTRPTLYRNRPVVVERFRAATAASRTPAAPSAPTGAQELRERNTKLRQENEQLRLHVELYEEHIRRLTVDDTRLANELAARGGVTDLSTHRPRHAGEP